MNTKIDIEPLKVKLLRGSYTESIHRVHVAICDNKGRVLMKAGDPKYTSFIRSAFKPFQALPFISSGTLERNKIPDSGLAISCGSHNGSTMHAREAFNVLWKSDIDVNLLKCPIPNKKKSPLEHNCSGKHSAFLATCRKMGWETANYLEEDHPLQIEIKRRLADILRVKKEELISAKDDCGAPTFELTITQMAFLYAHLSSSQHAELEKISRAIIGFPELIAGQGFFDTELMKRSHRQIISKGGSEGIQCIGRIGEGLGVAIKVEDGSKRAKHAAGIRVLEQLEWLTPTGIKELKQEVFNFAPGVRIVVEGELTFDQNKN